MEYILIYRQPAEIYEMNKDPIKGPPNLATWKQYMDAMGAAGIVRGGNRLEALAGSIVQIVNGKRQVQDGPYADSKDLLGGYVIIDVSSLDEALKWAELSPSSTTGATDVYPLMPMPKM
jgi:hypothetical protein